MDQDNLIFIVVLASIPAGCALGAIFQVLYVAWLYKILLHKPE